MATSICPIHNCDLVGFGSVNWCNKCDAEAQAPTTPVYESLDVYYFSSQPPGSVLSLDKGECLYDSLPQGMKHVSSFPHPLHALNVRYAYVFSKRLLERNIRRLSSFVFTDPTINVYTCDIALDCFPGTYQLIKKF